MLGVEEKDPVIKGEYADDLYEEYKSVYGKPETIRSEYAGVVDTSSFEAFLESFDR